MRNVDDRRERELAHSRAAAWTNSSAYRAISACSAVDAITSSMGKHAGARQGGGRNTGARIPVIPAELRVELGLDREDRAGTRLPRGGEHAAEPAGRELS